MSRAFPALSFVADLQDSSWGGRGSPGNHRSPQVRRRRSPFLSGRQQRPKQKQRNSWERTENENSSNHKEAYHETHGERAPACSKRLFFVSRVSRLPKELTRTPINLKTISMSTNLRKPIKTIKPANLKAIWTSSNLSYNNRSNRANESQSNLDIVYCII